MIQTRQSLEILRKSICGSLLALPAFAAEPTFNRDIRPILSENCFLCHGQDPAHRGGDLRLDVRDEAIATRDEGAAII
ncbi:MAG: c-type cytochrome domain-containing protein, partial [Akkermansiaceae bacterium]